jgi:hypothetical protein
MPLYWPGQDFVSTGLFQRARRFTCWRQSPSDLRYEIAGAAGRIAPIDFELGKQALPALSR